MGRQTDRQAKRSTDTVLSTGMEENTYKDRDPNRYRQINIDGKNRERGI
jgi:hypothetical protein